MHHNPHNPHTPHPAVDRRHATLLRAAAFAFASVFVCAADAQTSQPAANAAPAPSITGGFDAAIEDYPSLVALLDDANGQSDLIARYCGGALLELEPSEPLVWVLTAASCFIDPAGSPRITTDRLIVALGVTELSATARSSTLANTQPGGGAQFYAVAETFLHQSFDPDTNDNDIALLRMAVAASTGTAGAAPQPVSLNTERTGEGIQAHVAGWGLDANTLGFRNPTLQASSAIETVEMSDCQRQWSEGRQTQTITNRMLCAQHPDRSADFCTGDTGGPLLAADEGELRVIGIASRSPNCTTSSSSLASRPGIYTRVSEFTGWISETTSMSMSNGGDTTPPTNNNGNPPPDNGNPPASSGGSSGGGGGGGGGCAALDASSNKGHSADPLLWFLLLTSTLAAGLRLRRPTSPA